MTTRPNSLNQNLDVSGSLEQTDSAILANEPLHLGVAIQSGGGAIVAAGSPATITGLLGMLPNSEGNYLTISGSGLGNNGNYLIVNYISATSIQVTGASLVNEAGLGWVERRPYTLQDDLNFERTDRSAIKGVPYSSGVPTYFRCIDKQTPIPVNLNNISGKTTDAQSIIVNRKFKNIPVSTGDGYVTIHSTGNLKHADVVNVIGVPVIDGFDAGNHEGVYVQITDTNGEALYVFGGVYDGYRVFGQTREGTTSVSPDSVEVEFRVVRLGEPVENSVSYNWEVGEDAFPDVINIYYGYRECLSNLNENALRTRLVDGVIEDNDIKPTQIGQILYSIDGSNFTRATPVTSAEGWLVNEDGILIVNEG